MYAIWIKQETLESFSVLCNDHEITSQENVKFLGLTIDNLLNNEAKVDSIVKKVKISDYRFYIEISKF